LKFESIVNHYEYDPSMRKLGAKAAREMASWPRHEAAQFERVKG
jgi:hypothetical protein